MLSPLTQFELVTLKHFIGNGVIDLSITNFSVSQILLLFIIILIHFLNEKWLIKEKLEIVCAEITRDSLKQESEKYFPLIYLLFIFILINNVMGLIPHSFISTTHIFLTFLLSNSIFIGLNITGFKKHKDKIYSLFLPSNTIFLFRTFLTTDVLKNLGVNTWS